MFTELVASSQDFIGGLSDDSLGAPQALQTGAWFRC